MGTIFRHQRIQKTRCLFPLIHTATTIIMTDCHLAPPDEVAELPECCDNNITALDDGRVICTDCKKALYIPMTLTVNSNDRTIP